jgi:hypothetical protein
MDSPRLDALARATARSAFLSRRGLTIGLATLLPALLVGAGPGEAKKKRKKPRQPDPCTTNFSTKRDQNFCRDRRRRCKRAKLAFCITEGDPLDPAKVAICCPTGASCCGDTCCPTDNPNFQCCNGQCTSLNGNASHCGSCDHACGPDEACDGTTCVAKCSSGMTRCGRLCVDTSTDSSNCGTCGHSCGAGETCQGGQCNRKPSCPPNGCPDGEVCCEDHCCGSPFDG